MIRRMLLLFFILTALDVQAAWARQPSDNNQKKSEKKTQTNLFQETLELPFKTTEGIVTSVFNLGSIVITPTRTAENVNSVGSSISVFTEEELEARGIQTVKDALRKDYSVDVSQTGTFGGNTSIFLRGANAGHTRVMVDGVRVFDPMAPNGAFDLTHFNMDNVRQIEVVKGPHSSLYGSDAMGGLVNIISRRGHGKPSVSAYGEMGSFQTYRGGVDCSGQTGRLGFALGSSYVNTDGISSARRDLGNYEKDPYENQSYSARLDYDLSEKIGVSYIGRYSYADYELDDAFAPLDDDNRKAWTRQILSSVVIDYNLTENLGQKLQWSQTGNYRRDFDENDPAHSLDYLRDWYYGETHQVDWTASYRLFEVNTLVAGVNYLKEKGSSYYYSSDSFGVSEAVFPKRYADTTGYFGEYRLNINDRLASTLSTRIENHSEFNANNTYRADAVYRINNVDTKLRAGYGTGFKAPTLYQLYAPADLYFLGGNTQLKPEESETYEFGVEQPFFSEELSFGVSYFHNDFKNLIDAVYNPSTFITDKYKNVSRSESYGYELPFRYTPSKTLQVTGNFAWLETEDLDTHEELLRRAKHKFNAGFYFTPFEKTSLGADCSYVGHRVDSGGRLLKSYFKTDLKLSYDVNPNYNVYLKVENLFDKKYEVLADYGTPGFSAYTGVKVRF
ncbi:MAG: TonB-dependent receptor [Candidatus Omnitrophica bacterium]|nr:TonB-dependent receptor [Candidatus Omnitrophota bacterium]